MQGRKPGWDGARPPNQHHVQNQIRLHENRAAPGWLADSRGARPRPRSAGRSLRCLDGESRPERATAGRDPGGKNILARIQPALSEGTARIGGGGSAKQANKESRAEIYVKTPPASGEETNRHVAVSLRRGGEALPSAFIKGAAREEDLAATLSS